MPVFKKILLTGGGGFVGSYLAPLLAQAYPDAQKASLAFGEDRALPGGGWTAVRGDLLNAEAIDGIVSALRPDLVVHLAGQASIGAALGAGEQTWRANLHGTFNLASALARHAPEPTFLFASSASIYGASLLDGPATENTPLRPLDAYGRSKVAAEGALADVLGPKSRLLIARPVNHSGPRQSEKYFVLSSFAAQIAAIEAGRAAPLLHVGDLSKSRDFLDVRDVVSAYMTMIENAPQMPERVNYFNVASGKPHPISYFLEEMRRQARISFDIVVEGDLLRPLAIDIPVIACDAAKLRKLTGWRQRYAVEGMLRSLLDYWRDVEKKRAHDA